MRQTNKPPQAFANPDKSRARAPRFELRTLPPHPFVSIILPIRNEEDFIDRTLGAIMAQDYPHSCMEVLIADGESTDRTRQIVARLASAHPDLDTKIINNPGRIVPTGFNAAFRKARGEVIVRIDGHTIVSADYVRQCVNLLQGRGAANVGGRMDPVGTNRFGTAVALATTSPFGVGGSRFHYSRREEWVDTVYMGAWPREVFTRIGLLDEEQVRNQDDEFNYRLLSHGGGILLSPSIVSRYYNRGTVRSLWRQYFQYGYWKVRVIQKHPQQISVRQLVPGAFVGGLLLLAASAPFSGIAALALAGMTALYCGVNLFAAGLCARRKASAQPLVALAFAVMHISYGAGFLFGLIHFRKQWGVRTNHRGASSTAAGA